MAAIVITPREQLDRLFDPLEGVRDDKYLEYAQKVSDWHTALGCIGLLPKKIPALPENICQILTSECPLPRFPGIDVRFDGSPFRVYDTHSLYLIPNESLNQLEGHVWGYGENTVDEWGGKVYPKNPFKFRSLFKETREEFCKQVSDTHWVLISNEVLEGSRNLSPQKQVLLIEEVSKKALAQYKLPTLGDAASASLLHKVATGSNLYEGRDRKHYTYTRVEEAVGSRPIIVGGYNANGLGLFRFLFNDEIVGAAAVRTL